MGLLINGIVSDKFGYKKTMFISLILMLLFTFIPFFAENVETLVAGGFLQGIPWGIFQTLTVTYASDICPVVLRAYLTTYVNLCWVIGQLIATAVLRAMISRDDEWAYRIPFGLQWVWPLIILPFVFIAPESPWWLVRQGREEDAKAALYKLTSTESGVAYNIDAQVAMIRTTNEMERQLAQSTTYLQCFRGIDLRRTEISCIVWLTQQYCGSALMGYSVQFLQRGGLDEENAINMSIGQYAMGAVGTILSWFVMGYVGRRKIYIWGIGVMIIVLMGIGCAGIPERLATNDLEGPQEENEPLEDESAAAASWAIGSLIIVYTFVYDITVGPVCYALVAEIPSTRMKIKTVVLARNLYNLGAIVNNIIMPKMLLPTAWNWGAFTAFFWAGCSILLFIWCFFRLPEPMGRTFAELDVLFENKVSARKFHKTHVDQFGGVSPEQQSVSAESGLEKNEKGTVELKETAT